MAADAALQHLKEQHPYPERLSQFVSTCKSIPRTALRVNFNRTSIADFRLKAKQRGWNMTAIPWTENGFWIEHNTDQALGNHIDHLSGLFYLQESTSMLPVEALFHGHSPKLILDMAAAPGSKTTQLQNHAENAFIVANDMSSSRVKMLNANLIRCGVANYALLHQDARTFPEQMYGQFDGILLDAPCGGEGTIRKDPKAWNNWSPESLKSLSDLQKELILSAWQLLAPGGRLIYSTCSLSQEENQQVVTHLMSQHSDEAKLIKLDSLFPEAERVSDNGMLHIWPEVFDTEGFFVSVIEKSITAKSPSVMDASTTNKQFNSLSKKQYETVAQYMSQRFGYDLSDNQTHLAVQETGKQQIVWLKSNLPDSLQTLRTQRSGVKLCTLFNSRKGLGINLEHEFCRTHGSEFSRNTLELSDTDVVAYFKGMNIKPNHELTEGEVVLTHQHTPIGIGKVLKNGQVKNQLPRPLVHDNAWA